MIYQNEDNALFVKIVIYGGVPFEKLKMRDSKILDVMAIVWTPLTKTSNLRTSKFFNHYLILTESKKITIT